MSTLEEEQKTLKDALTDIEQRVEDAIEDDSEEVWKTFLEIEPHYRTTNRWLAES